MSSPLQRQPSSATAHIVPLALFMLITASTDLFRIENSALPWYQRAPEHWVYPLQCLIVGTVLWIFRRHYTLAPWKGLGLASLFAFVGIGLWILPSTFYHEGQPEWLEWLGIAKRTEGFDPSIFDKVSTDEDWHVAIYRTKVSPWLYDLAQHTSAWWLTVLLRFFRMVIIVPLVEELFWRGFLMRFLQAGDRSFLTVPFGQHSWKTYWIVTLAVTLIHNPEDYLGAFVWGSLMYFLAVRTKSLGACVFMHAAGNLLLGLYVMQTKQWGFW